jgi:hypothetical protein
MRLGGLERILLRETALPPYRSRWLMRMGFRSGLAMAVAVVLFAVAWAVCDQVAGLGVGGSSAVAGVLAVAAFGLTLRVTRPERARVRDLRSAQAEPVVLRWRVDTPLHGVFVEPAARSSERGRDSPEKPRITARSAPHARDIPAREHVRTVVTQDIQLIVDDAGMQVRSKRKMVGSEVWEEHLRIEWPAVTAIGFATGRHDPVVALYVWVTGGKSHHVADSRFFNDLQWTRLGKLIAEATHDRLTLDVGSRYDPRSIRPDW